MPANWEKINERITDAVKDREITEKLLLDNGDTMIRTTIIKDDHLHTHTHVIRKK